MFTLDVAIQRSAFVFAAVLAIAGAGPASGQASGDARPVISDKPLTAEQLAIYRTVLSGWMDKEMSSLNLSIQTVPLGETAPDNGAECAKGLELEPAAPGVVHRFRPQDAAQLAPGKTIVLVDPDRQRKVVRDNDPGKAIREGASVEDAIRNGFAHGLTTLSEIRFDKQHKLAIVSYGFYCGGLCGNGGTVVLEKDKNGAWQRKSGCHDWISRLPQPQRPANSATGVPKILSAAVRPSA